jgi:phage terminase large subunit
VNNGIDIMKRYRLHITRRSVGIRREVNNYKWKVGKDGEPTNEPTDAFNHALDASRYVCMRFLNIHRETRGLTRRN